MENKKKKLFMFSDKMKYMNSRPNSLGQKKRQIPNDETSAEKPSVKITEIEVMFITLNLTYYQFYQTKAKVENSMTFKLSKMLLLITTNIKLAHNKTRSGTGE
jgi:hypothetical protein